MRLKRAKFIILAFALMLIAIPFAIQAAALSAGKQPIFHHQFGPAPIAGMSEVPDGTLEELADFKTNLPIVVMDVDGQPFHTPSVWDNDKGYQVSVIYDPYNEGTLSLFDSADGINRLTDTPALQTNIHTRIRGFSSLSYPKKQYLIKMLNEDGAHNPQNVLNLGSEWEWVLNISFIDTSLLRNYMSYNIAREIMGIAPKTRFCEVFLNDHGIYQYQGLYLFIDTIKQGEDRVPITDYNPAFTESAYLLKRDRYNEDDIILDTYGTRNGLTAEYLSIKYPSQNIITEDTVRYIENDISAFEEALFSEDVNEFLRYRDFINIDSFLDYFLINEFFTNYDANLHSMYLYKDLHGKLTMGPVWDFDQAMDNDFVRDLKIDSTAMHDGVWFRQLLRDGEFVKLLIDRYTELRKGPLSEENISKFIDEAAAFIEPARQRDWNRWAYDDYYERQYDEDLHTKLKRGGFYGDAILQLKTTLHDHGAWMDEHLDTLYQYSTIEPGQYRIAEAESTLSVFFGSEHAKWVLGALAVVFLIIFFVSISLIQKE